MDVHLVDARLGGMPPWFRKSSAKINVRKNNVDLFYSCTCKPHQRQQETVWVGSSGKSDEYVADRLAAKVIAGHPQCGRSAGKGAKDQPSKVDAAEALSDTLRELNS